MWRDYLDRHLMNTWFIYNVWQPGSWCETPTVLTKRAVYPQQCRDRKSRPNGETEAWPNTVKVDVNSLGFAAVYDLF